MAVTAQEMVERTAGSAREVSISVWVDVPLTGITGAECGSHPARAAVVA
jgi:hypothetical protein